MKKLLRTVLILTVLTAVALTAFACNKKGKDGVDTSDLLNVYKNHSSVAEFTSAKAEMTLPAGWSVYTTSTLSYKAGSDTGYIPSLDAFVITNCPTEKANYVSSNTYFLNLIKCGSSTPLFQDGVAITALKVYEGLIVVKSADASNSMSVYDSNGSLKISRANIVNTGTATIDTVLAVLTSELVAVKSSYDANAGGTNYTSIYRVSTGKVAARVKNQGGALANVDGFDGDYVVVTGTTESSADTARIFKIPAGAPASPANYDGEQSGTFISNGETEYYIEITYMGGGKFFVHEDWQVTKDDDYTYYDESHYMKVSRHTYDANSNSLTTYNSDYYFLNLANQYYDSARNGIASGSFLKDGFYYSSYGIYVDGNKNGYYDQFILDSNLNIVLSLSGNFGLKLDKAEQVDEVGYFDLAMVFKDEIGVVSVLPSIMRAYTRQGGVVFSNDTLTITSAGYNNGMIVATALNTSGKTVYGVFNMEGKIVAPFIYSKIDPFLGYYTIAERANDSGTTIQVLLSKDGTEIAEMSDLSKPLADLATTSSKTAIYKVGCYMSTETKDGVAYYGVKNLDANVSKNTIMANTMVSGSILYSSTSSPENVFVFAKFSATDNFTIYRLV